MFQASFKGVYKKGVSRKLLECFKEVSGKFQGCFKKVSRTFQLRWKGVSNSFKGVQGNSMVIQVVLKKYQGSFKSVEKKF